jgi:hypothetical protein
MQCQELVTLFGASDRTRRWCAVIAADIVDQGLYLQRYKRFPADQRGFVSAYLVDSVSAMNAKW